MPVVTKLSFVALVRLLKHYAEMLCVVMPYGGQFTAFSN
jgi:hypothetical protein